MAETAMARVDEIHAKSTIEEVELSKLQVDYTYQRDPSEPLVDQIANDWDQVASELLLVSNRGTRTDSDVRGGLFIVNGQHRSKAAAKKGMEKVWARVIDLRKEKDPGAVEAEFRLKTNVRLPDQALERFKAQVRAGNEESLSIQRILASFGTAINVKADPNVGINCVATVEKLYRIDDGSILRDTLEIIKDTWKDVGGARTQSALMKGIAWFIDKHAEESDRTRLVSKLQGCGLTALKSRANTTHLTLGGSQWINYYRSIVDLYNEQLSDKNRLQWMLRGSQTLSD